MRHCEKADTPKGLDVMVAEADACFGKLVQVRSKTNAVIRVVPADIVVAQTKSQSEQGIKTTSRQRMWSPYSSATMKRIWPTIGMRQAKKEGNSKNVR